MNPDDLRTALADLADEVRPVDLSDRARATSRQTARRQVAATATAVAVVLTAGGFAFAGQPGFDRRPVGPADERTGNPLTEGEVTAATVRVPVWQTAGCPAGDVRLSDPGPELARWGPVTLGDVDRDGTGDALVVLRCQVGENQVLALHRAPDGTVATLGQVVTDRPVVGGAFIAETQVGPPGLVEVIWRDGAVATAERQRRTYEWNGTGFSQTSGPKSFPPAAYDVRISAKPVRLVSNAAGDRAGDLELTVENAGTITLGAAKVTLETPVPMTVRSMIGAATDHPDLVQWADPPLRLEVTLKPLLPGDRTTVTMRLVYPRGMRPAGGILSMGATGDATPDDNQVSFVAR
ncbi:hypothetical protein Ais01nite_84270 [Asanoa ishikariensis]|uniref:Uncharacterized protein n=1 Tax=Asanoa ishikariensis TaxID=137265 RepID=A0A1H3KDV9_9ACTN|nr:hypothetical protein [Asanoa ishikariensis]GIF70392.1 hypothetical protein Ais01nite_84270 [Asanoa ishikariensis]SDY50273.1 hypothetical protein SAMN05421684_0088 [Asanoa ishikariensis]